MPTTEELLGAPTWNFGETGSGELFSCVDLARQMAFYADTLARLARQSRAVPEGRINGRGLIVPEVDANRRFVLEETNSWRRRYMGLWLSNAEWVTSRLRDPGLPDNIRGLLRKVSATEYPTINSC
jgi:hypothetical protein